MFTKSFLTAAAAVACVLCATEISYAQQAKHNYQKSVFRNFKNLPANRAAGNKTIEAMHATFPGWTVTTDKLTGSFTDIYGAPVNEQGGNNADKAENTMVQQLKQFGVNADEWQFVSSTRAPKADYVYYRQVVKGHTVAFASINFRFTKDGQLERIQMKNYGTPAVTATLSLTASDAKVAAVKDLDGVAISNAVIDNNWSWFPIPSANGYTLHPAWHFTVTGKVPGTVPLKLTGYIDATNGDLLYRNNEVKETTYDLTVKGMVYKNGTLHPATAEPLADLDLNILGIDHFTDTGGLFSSSLLALPLTTTIPLQGWWSTVIDSTTGLMPSFTDLVTIPGTTYMYPVTAPSSSRHVNAYYHVNRVHNFMKGYFPAFTGMDFSLPTNVDLTSGTCNAFYSGSDINFYAADPTCHSFAEIGDIIYHEYGHGISDHFYTEITGGTIMNGALNEAMSDIWALSITHNPVLGENSYVGYGGFIRRYDMMPQVYPVDLQGFDPHKDGQIIAGTWWDVAVNIGSADTMTQLFTDVYYDVPDGPDGDEGQIYQSILISALMADDNDHNLLNGTPHYNQIVAAFAKHGLYLEGDVNLTHTELPQQPAGAPITVTATLNMDNHTYFHDLTLYYIVNGTGTYTPVVCTVTGSTYSATIPAQPAGTVVDYYFGINDALHQFNAFFPIAHNVLLPAYQQNIEYQFGVGLSIEDSTTFETAASATGWHIGRNTGDNATSGIWVRNFPGTGGGGGSFFDPFPTGDNTTGNGRCLVTGTAASSSNGIQDGTTTVISPVFDISGFTTPVVSYYRWFSNELYLENFKKDPWIVKIRDTANTNWETVENTYQGDDSWRHRIFRVSEFLPATTKHIQLKFFASDSTFNTWADGGQNVVAGGIDDFFIYDKNDAHVGVANVGNSAANIFPNPANDQIKIVLLQNVAGSINLYDMLGRRVAGTVMDQNSNSYSIDTKSLAAGNYSVVIQTAQSIQSKRVTVIHP